MLTTNITIPSAGPYSQPGETITVAPSCRQAIVTRYHGPGAVRGSRITAQCAGGKVTLPYDHVLNAGENHAAAAAALAAKLGWTGRMVGGGHPDGRGDVFVFVD